MDRRDFLKLAGVAALAPKEVIAQSPKDPNTLDLSAFTYAETGTPGERVMLQRELIDHIKTLEKSGKIKQDIEGSRNGLYKFDFKDSGVLGVEFGEGVENKDSVGIYFYLPTNHPSYAEGWILRVVMDGKGNVIDGRANLETAHITIKNYPKENESRDELWTREFYGAVQMILANT